MNDVAVSRYFSAFWISDRGGGHAFVVPKVPICVVEASRSFLIDEGFVGLVRLFSLCLGLLLDEACSLFYGFGHGFPVQSVCDGFIRDCIGKITVEIFVRLFGYTVDVVLDVCFTNFLFGFDPTVACGNGSVGFSDVGI